jgi:ABC-type branched-subunit amino acid transport system permease subunit
MATAGSARAARVAVVVGAEAAAAALSLVFLTARAAPALLAPIAAAAAIAVAAARAPRLRAAIAGAFRGERSAALATAAVLLLALPLLLRRDAYSLHILVVTGIQVILALGLNLQVGSAGLPNLGFAAFYGIGAYTSALLAVRLGVPFWVGLAAGGAVSAAFGLVLGFPTLKTRTYYLALITIAFGLVVYLLMLNLRFLDGPDGVRDIPPPRIAGWPLVSSVTLFGGKYPMQLNYFYLVFAFTALAVAGAHALHHSRTGLAWNAVREDEIASQSVGINVSASKLLAFAAGAFYAGAAGALYAHYVGYISAQNFTLTQSLALLSMVILGGLDNIGGVALAAVLLSVLPEKFRALSDYRVIAYGVIIIAMLIFRPAGLIPQTIRDYGFALKRKARHG